MKSLNNIEWKEFFLSEIFDIVATSSGIDKNKLINKSGNIPYVTRTDKNNGLESFVGIHDCKYSQNNNNTITIGLDTQTVFYQPSNFYTGQNIQILSNPNLNKDIALFFIPLIKILLQKFNWGSNGATLTRLKRGKILVPINRFGEPDYEFMESFIKNNTLIIKEKYKAYVAEKIIKLERFIEQKKEWKAFKIQDLFNIGKGDYLPQKKIVKGDIPYITAKNSNNGIKDYIGNKANFKGNSISIEKVNLSSFYQNKSFYCSHDVSVITNSNLNKYIGLFICTMINRQAIKYSYGRQAQMNIIKRETILLPISDGDEPDYEYMQNYMKYLEQKKILQYLDFCK